MGFAAGGSGYCVLLRCLCFAFRFGTSLTLFVLMFAILGILF